MRFEGNKTPADEHEAPHSTSGQDVKHGHENEGEKDLIEIELTQQQTRAEAKRARYGIMRTILNELLASELTDVAASLCRVHGVEESKHENERTEEDADGAAYAAQIRNALAARDEALRAEAAARAAVERDGKAAKKRERLKLV